MIQLSRRILIPLIALGVVAAAAMVVWPRSQTMYSRMSVELYPGNAPEELARPGALKAAQPVKVLERRSPWAKVRVDNVDGWLPEWYLIPVAADALPDIEAYQRVVNGPGHVWLYPDDSAPVVRTLETGKVVTVRATMGDWRYVDIIVYDIPAISRGWVKAGVLATAGEVAPTEGWIRAGTTVYHGEPTATDPKQLPSEATTYEMVVSISAERGDMALVRAAGGWDGWVAKRDIVFDVIGK